MQKNFYKIITTVFSGQTKENVGNWLKVEINSRDDDRKTSNQQSKTTFKGVYKSNTSYDSYT